MAFEIHFIRISTRMALNFDALAVTSGRIESHVFSLARMRNSFFMGTMPDYYHKTSITIPQALPITITRTMVNEAFKTMLFSIP